MKKTIVIIFLSIFVVVCVAVLLPLSHLALPKAAVKVTGNIVDNDHNNYIGGGALCRIGDTLYFNYGYSKLNYGIFAISKTGSKKIYWRGRLWLDPSFLNERMYKHGDTFYRTNRLNENYSEYFDFASKKFVNYCNATHVQCVKMFQFYNDDYYFLKEKGSGEDLCKKTDDGDQVIIPDVSVFYIADNNIYYSKRAEEEYFIQQYNMNTKDETTLFTWPRKVNNYIDNIVVHNGYIVFKTGNFDGIYKFKIGGSDKIETIYTYKGLTYFNVYGGKVYVCTDDALLTFDLETGQENTLYSGYAQQCYIVDDKWVYFIGEEADLLRVTQDGKTVEKVFG